MDVLASNILGNGLASMLDRRKEFESRLESVNRAAEGGSKLLNDGLDKDVDAVFNQFSDTPQAQMIALLMQMTRVLKSIDDKLSLLFAKVTDGSPSTGGPTDGTITGVPGQD